MEAGSSSATWSSPYSRKRWPDERSISRSTGRSPRRVGRTGTSATDQGSSTTRRASTVDGSGRGRPPPRERHEGGGQVTLSSPPTGKRLPGRYELVVELYQP